MDNQTPTTSTTSTSTSNASATATSQPSPSTALPSPAPPPLSQPPSSVPSLPSPSPSPSSTLTPNANATPNPNPNPSPNQPLNPSISTSATQSHPHIRPQTVAHRPAQHQHFQHFSPIASTTPSPTPLSPSFGQVRPGMGMVGSTNSTGGSQIRATGIAGVQHPHHQPRPSPLQSSVRPPSTSSPNSHSAATHNLQGHGFVRTSAVGPGSQALGTSQNIHSANQPWLSSGSQGKPPLSSAPFRPPISSPSVQHRSHISQPHHNLPTISQQQHLSPAQPQQSLSSNQQSEHFGQPFPPPRGPRSITQQLSLQSLSNQRQSSLAAVHPNTLPSSLPSTSPNTIPNTLPNSSPSTLPNALPNAIQPGTHNRIANAESDEPYNRILSKRSIHELVTQIDPSEKLDPEVEDILVDIADEFVESITTFGCSLAKHRKADALEAKDILLHLERNWNMTLPGFSGDEIKTYRKPITSDLHKERLALVKKSMLASEMAGARNSVGQAAGNVKGNLTRTNAPSVKIPEVN